MVQPKLSARARGLPGKGTGVLMAKRWRGIIEEDRV